MYHLSAQFFDFCSSSVVWAILHGCSVVLLAVRKEGTGWAKFLQVLFFKMKQHLA